MKKLPPIEKVFEAWTAIADNRIKLHENYAEVSSSDNQKDYIVKFDDNRYSSDDNATYWQGYPGYPVIAVMMLQGKLPYEKKEAEKWSNINWTETNKNHRNRYAEAVADVARKRDINLEDAYRNAEKVMEKLKEFNPEIKRKL